MTQPTPWDGLLLVLDEMAERFTGDPAFAAVVARGRDEQANHDRALSVLLDVAS